MRKKSYSLKHRITGFLLAAAVAATGSLSFSIPAKAAENLPAAITSGQLNWTGHGFHWEYNEGTTHATKEYTFTNGANLTISDSARINVYSDAEGTLGSLTIGDNSYFSVGGGANVWVTSIVNNSSGGANGGGVIVESGGTLRCQSITNNARVISLGTMEIAGNLYNYSDFNTRGTAVTNCGVVNNTSTDKGLNIESGTTLNYTSAGTLSGKVTNAGTISTTSSSFTSTGTVVNSGVISAHTINLTSATVSDQAGAEYRVTHTFKNGASNLVGTVIPNNSTLEGNEAVNISSTGGSVTVKLDGVTVTKSGTIDETAGSFVPQASVSRYTSIPTYYGMDISEYSDLFAAEPGGATKTVEYAKVGTTTRTTTVPTEIGTYNVYVNLSGTAALGYRAIPEFTETLERNYLPPDVVGGAFPRCTVATDAADVIEIPYYKDELKLNAPAGYKIYNSDGTVADSITISDHGYHMGYRGQYKVASNSITTGGSLPYPLTGAITETTYYYTSNFIIDAKAPEMVSALDQDGNDVKLALLDGEVIARSLDVSLEDMSGDWGTMRKVTLDGSTDGVTVDRPNAKYTVHIGMKLPGKETHTIYAEDVVGHTKSWTITMTYLPTATPATPFTVKGTEGKNGFYTSDLTLVAADGYQICDSLNGAFADSIVYKSSMENVWLTKKSNGAFTEAISLDDVKKIKVDKAQPTFSKNVTLLNGDTKELKEKGVYTSKKMSFSVTDENLASVTINDTVNIPVEDGKADINLATIASTKDYKVVAEDLAGNTSTINVTLSHSRIQGEATIAIADYYYGMTVDPRVAGNSDMVEQATVYYKGEDEDVSNFNTARPISVGSYIAKVIVPVSDDYTEATAETAFDISYYPTPEKPYTLSGTEGNNKYFKSDVEIVAPEGFTIASSVSEEGSRRVAYTEGMNGFYLRKVDDGATTAFVPITETIKIDKEIPVLAGTARDQDGQSVGIVHGTTYMADTMTFTITDDHLKWLTINGVKTEVFGGKAVVSLDAKKGIREFVIAAEDEAGNVYNVTVTLMATWYKDKIIPIGAPVPLSTGEIYKLGGGIWRVNEGQTLYPGGGSFCVVIPGDYTFVTTE